MKYFMSIVATLFLATASYSATLNFADEADANGERGGLSETLTLDSTTITLSAGGTNAYYLDSSSGGKLGGLGVCSTGLTSSAQCNTPSDDNITGDEEVFVSFALEDDEAVTVQSMTFRDGNHNLLEEGDEVLVSFDGGATYETHTTDASGVVTFADGGRVVDGDTIAVMKKEGQPQLYLSSMSASVGKIDTTGNPPSPVPLPAALWLLATGLGGLGLFKKISRA